MAPHEATTPPLDSDVPPTAARTAGSTLLPGEILAGRFCIARLIAQGGMGEVWEAEDLEFVGERVAVKTIRPEIARDAWAISRFRREIQLSKKVTHPNVCRVFDLFRHEGEGPSRRITFLTMELLPGETLAARIGRGGAMPAGVVQPIARQMAAALAAAHAAGVVHGDFKSSNVMVAGEGEAVRAVVTDFGLARRESPGSDRTSSASVNFVGTPAYMAPERINGGGPSIAGDVYALGVVLYEMVTGRLPFEGETPFAAAITSSPPPSPRRFAPDLDAAWERTILRCLAADPRDRFSRAAEVARALGGEAGPAATQAIPAAPAATAPESPRRRRAWLAAGLASALLATAAAGLWLHASLQTRGEAPSGAPPGTSATVPRRSVAVLGFKNLSGRPDAAWLSVALSEMLATDLAAGGKLRLVPAETVSRMKVDFALADFDTLSQETLTHIRGNLGSDLVVLGSYIALGREAGGRIRLDLRLQDARTGETVAAVSRNGTEAGLFDLVGGVGADLRRELGVGAMTARETGAALVSFPASPEAARLYAEGLARLRLFDAAAARDLLIRAVTVSPDQPLAHAALSAAWSDLGYEERAREEARRAFELSSGLPREQRLAVEGRFREVAGEPSQAAEIYRTLFGFFPDNLEYGLRLAAAQVAGGQIEAAQQTLKLLRQLPSPAASDPRIDLAEAEALEARSDFVHEREAAERAAAAGTAQGARLLVARAQLLTGTAARNLGDHDKAAAAFEEARRLFAGAGDRAGVARAVNSLGIVAWQRGDDLGGREPARRLYEEALAAFRDIGDRRGAAQSLNNIAILLWQQGDLAGAKEIYGKVLAVYRETGNRRGLASSLSNLGMVQRAEGDLAAARRTHEEALNLRRAIGERQGEAVSLNNLAQVLSDEGDLTGARDLYGKAIGLFQEIGNQGSAADALMNLGEVDWERGEIESARHSFEAALAIKRKAADRAGTATALAGLGDVHLDRGDLAAAARSYGESAELREALGKKAGAARARRGLAATALAADDPARAEPLARAAIVEAHSAGAASDTAGVEADGELLLARCLLALGKPADARQALDRARDRAGRNPDRRFRLAAAITGARIAAAQGKAADARAALTPAQAEARQGGLTDFELEAALALGELELRGGEAETGRTHLEAVLRQARAKGFAGRAAQAERLLAAGH
jgi:tetratricopeptide (TPR) repeat protein/TolB-like protein/tRNA A-37 threonylcarbamoyl transferase component Bud32